MKKSLACSFALAGLLGSAAGHANAPVAVDSKEYKVLLDPARFAGDPQGAAASLLAAVKARLAQLDFDKSISGSFAAGDSDQVSYYDTPGSCALHGSGYSLRVRAGDDQDVEFKYGHPDEELSYYTDVSGAGKNASSKLETDVSPGKLVYSHSTEQDTASGGAPASVSALIAQFPGASALSAYASQPLAVVNGLTVNQQEYDGPSSDIGQSTAKFTLTLWYLGDAGAPALAELSFRVKADGDKYFTTPVLQRSQVLMAAISSLDGWELTPSTTKTAWVYAYKSASYPDGFCSAGD
jgi:hypothetical protein